MRVCRTLFPTKGGSKVRACRTLFPTKGGSKVRVCRTLSKASFPGPKGPGKPVFRRLAKGSGFNEKGLKSRKVEKEDSTLSETLV